MKALADRGYPQAVLPPHERPIWPRCARSASSARRRGIARAARDAPPLLAACSSLPRCGSPTPPPSARRPTPPTVACISRPPTSPRNFHRSLEAPTTTRVLRAIFADDARFAVHDPLPAAAQFGDEGAANHTRFLDAARPVSSSSSTAGRLRYAAHSPSRFPGASDARSVGGDRATARLGTRRVVLFAQQNPAVIDAGVFHNDVIAVGNRRRAVLSRKRLRRPAAACSPGCSAARRTCVRADRRHRRSSPSPTRSRRISSTAS